jgi:hypothetical protein
MGGAAVKNQSSDALALQRVLVVFERNYHLSSADFYRAHLRDETPAADLSPWHREVWSGTYRQLLNGRGAESAESTARGDEHPIGEGVSA